MHTYLNKPPLYKKIYNRLKYHHKNIEFILFGHQVVIDFYANKETPKFCFQIYSSKNYKRSKHIVLWI